MLASEHLAALAHPIIALVIGLFFLIAAATRKANYFLPAAAAYIAFAVGIVLQILLLPGNAETNAMLTGVAYAIAALGFYQALVRVGAGTPSWSVAIGLTLAFLALRYFHTAQSFNSIGRIYGIQTYLTVIFLLACWHARALLTRGSGPERFLFLCVSIFALSLLPRTFLTVGTDASRYGFDRTPFWVSTQIAWNVFIVVFALALLLVHASRRLQMAEHRASIDPLTRLDNRASFNAKAEFARGRCACYSLISIDIDRFKSINDRWGHLVGDRVLERVAALISGSTREADEAARYGGEEFLVFLPDTGIDKAHKIAERLRQSVAAAAMQDIAPDLRCTASLGVAEFDSSVPLKSAHQRVDQLLYAAKGKGRNQVCHDPQPLTEADVQCASAAIVPINKPTPDHQRTTPEHDCPPGRPAARSDR